MQQVKALRALPRELGAEQIKACAYQFSVRGSGETDLDIDAGGRRVLLRSSSKQRLEQDFALLIEIAGQLEHARPRSLARPVELPRVETEGSGAPPWRPDALFRSPALMRDRSGRLALRGAAAELLEGLDLALRRFARELEAEAFHAEPTWRAGDLPAFGYGRDSAFLCRLSHLEAEAPDYWQNAVCNNVWRHLAGHTFDGQARRFTARGTCCRHEGAQHFALEYLRAFTMRELVIAGAPEQVLAQRERAQAFALAFAAELGLRGRLERANDPFFLASEDSEQAQEQCELPELVKVELRLELYGERTLACASFNVHGDFFAQRLDMRGGEAPVWTGCSAFGLERWVWAVLVQHGPDPRSWPEGLRALLSS